MSAIADRVEAIARRVSAGRFGRRRPWGGADVAIVAESPEPRPDHFYPDPRFVVTPHVRELSWLFESLRDAFAGTMDYLSKYEFHDRLADAAERYQGDVAPESRSVAGLLSAVLAEARVLACECGPEARPHIDPSSSTGPET